MFSVPPAPRRTTLAFIRDALGYVPSRLPKGSGSTTVSGGPGNPVVGLGLSGVVAATYGDATHVGQFTVNDEGLITGAANVGISGGGGGGWTVYTTVLNDTTHTFSGLSGGNDLEIEVMGASDQGTNQSLLVTVNAVVTGYNTQRMFASGTATPSADFVSGGSSWNVGSLVGTTATVVPPSILYMKIFDFANTAFNKGGIFSMRAPSTGSGAEVVLSGSMAVTGIPAAAITSITIAVGAGHFFIGSILKVRET